VFSFCRVSFFRLLTLRASYTAVKLGVKRVMVQFDLDALLCSR
jgi:hypothetical protein